jgi:hypothetical protein
MSAGPQYEYLWADGLKVKTPVKLSAPDYINSLFDWVEDQVGRMEHVLVPAGASWLHPASARCASASGVGV